MDTSTEETFTLDLSYLKDIRNLVTCQKCNKLLQDPMEITICKHTFCSPCLQKMICPNCKTKFLERDLRDPDIFVIRSLNLIRDLEPLAALKRCEIRGIPVDLIKRKFREVAGEKATNELINQKQKWEKEGEFLCSEICDSRPIKRVGCIMKRNPKGETSLHIACKKGDYLKVLELAGNGVDLNITDWANWTPLHEAVLSQSVNCVQILLSKGALVNVYGEHYMTPLHQAVSGGNDEIVILLLKYGADKDAADYTGLTVLELQTTPSIKDIITTRKRLKTLPTQYLYYEQHSTVFLHDVDDQRIVDFYKDKYIFTKNPMVKNIFLCVVGRELGAEVLRFVAEGIMIVRVKDLCEFLNLNLPYVPKLIPEEIRTGLLRAIRFHLEKKPKLFDGMNFHVSDHQKPVEIKGCLYTKTELEMLIKSAGGNILIRAPAERTAADNVFCPYHSKDCPILKKCCNFVVYSHKEPPILLYNMVELRHVSSEWVVECVLNYKITF